MGCPQGPQCDSLASHNLISQLVIGDAPAYFPLFSYWESVAVILEDKENPYHLVAFLRAVVPLIFLLFFFFLN